MELNVDALKVPGCSARLHGSGARPQAAPVFEEGVNVAASWPSVVAYGGQHPFEIPKVASAS